MPRLPCTKKLPCAPGRACGGQGGSPIPVTCRTEQKDRVHAVARTGTLVEVSGKGWKVSGCGERQRATICLVVHRGPGDLVLD